MANAYINLYMNNPTAGGVDGTAISTDGTYTSPLTVNLNAAQNESKTVRLAIRTENGYVTSGETSISDYNDTADRWKFSLVEDGEYSDVVTISDAINSTNTVFWARATSSSIEAPNTDRSVSFVVSTVVKTI